METSIQDGKPAAWIAYLTLIGTIIAYILNNEKKNKFTAFHIRQGLGINITFYLLGLLVSYFDSWLISGAFYVFIVSLFIYGFVAALQGKWNLVPLMGKFYQNIFSSIA